MQHTAVAIQAVLHHLAILVVIVTNYLLNSLPIMYVIIFFARRVGPWNRLPVDIDFYYNKQFDKSVRLTEALNLAKEEKCVN